jgi:hypothetical protein
MTIVPPRRSLAGEALALVGLIASGVPLTAQEGGEESAAPPPVITAVEVLEVGQNEVEIRWEVEPPATGQVAFGRNPQLGRLSALGVTAAGPTRSRSSAGFYIQPRSL